MPATATTEQLPVAAPPAVMARELVYAWPDQEPVLDIQSLRIDPGERVFMLGPSGSGKSTLLGLIGGVLDAGSGELHVLDTPLHTTRVARRDRLRADHIGFIFQLFNLLPYLSVIDNVVLPCRFSERRYERAIKQSSTVEQEAERLLDHLGVTGALLQREVSELSIGQQQRVAAARALIGEPELLIADEPTSALDQALRARFIELLLQECAAAGSAVLFVSHDTSLSDSFDRSIVLPDINRAGRGHE
jgi:putative ABC transport system ATP-binding protein